MKPTDFSGKQVTVLGLGRSGIAAAILLKEAGAQVTVSETKEESDFRRLAESLERKGILVELGGHTPASLKGRDLIVTSPGVSPASRPFQWAKEEGIPVISEIELGTFFCPAEIIAVTGTNGKSTTVTLLGNILKAAGKRAHVCGNVGEAFCGVIPKIQKGDWVVLEVSSFQLETCYTFRPRIAVVLNLTSNHLDRHASFEAYLLAKRRIARSQTEKDFLLLNADDPFVRMFGKGLSVKSLFFSRSRPVEGSFLREGEFFVQWGGKEEWTASLRHLQLQGPHHEENALAAILASRLAGVSSEAIEEGLSGFRGLRHRLTLVGEKSGVQFFNDSKSTTVASTLRALETVPEPIFLIAGGRAKNEDFRTFAKSPLLKKVKRMFLIGESRDKILAAVSGKVPTFLAGTLEEAVTQAFQEAHPGETVLLSPMCASFDMFRDFEARGEYFERCVTSLEALHAR